jgi:thioredoxin-related protein
MKNTRILTLTLLAFVALAWIVQAADKENTPEPDQNGITWYSYQDGWNKAKAENKHLFVDFTATWCGWCKRLEQTTFSEPKVAKALNDDFVPVKVWEKSKDTVNIDGYKISERDLAKREFRVRGYPSLWFVSPKGVRIGPAGGYIDAGTMLKYLDIVKNYRYDSTLDENGNPIDTGKSQQDNAQKDG